MNCKGGECGSLGDDMNQGKMIAEAGLNLLILLVCMYIIVDTVYVI